MLSLSVLAIGWRSRGQYDQSMLDLTTTQSLELFMAALRGQNYSPKTLRVYGDDLRQFLAWVREHRVDWDIPKRFSRVDIEGSLNL